MNRVAALLLAVIFSSAVAQTSDPFAPGYSPHNAPSTFVSREKNPDAEEDVKLPAYPKDENLIEFEVRPAGSFRFYVDAASVASGADGIVRYAVVVRSSSGAENVSYDGLRCSADAHRVFATGRSAEQTWLPARTSEWKRLALGALGRHHLVLMRDFFCPAGIAISSASEGVDALRGGGHPHAISTIRQFGPRGTVR